MAKDEPIDPKKLFVEAQAAPSKGVLWEYMETITLLRERKKYTFKAIADWLSTKGIPADHNAVYRAYRKALKSRETKKGKSE